MGRYAQTPAPALSRIGFPLARVLNALSARWGVLVLEALADRHVRFNELCRHLTGINHKVLIETLRALQRDGFVFKLVVKGLTKNQDFIEYRLTDLGGELHEWINEITLWADERERGFAIARIEQNRHDRYFPPFDAGA